MSTRVIRSINDFTRHRMQVEVQCRCGNVGVLDPWMVRDRFSKNRWSTSLVGGFLDSPFRHFYCSVCWKAGRGKQRPVRIGPVG